MQIAAEMNQTEAWPLPASGEPNAALIALRKKVTDAEAADAKLLAKLDTAVAEFSTRLPNCIASWAEQLVRSQIEANYAVAARMSDGELRSLKAEVAAYVRELPGLCKTALLTRSRWSHRTEQPDMRAADRFCAEAICPLLSPIGSLLVNYRIADNTSGRRLWNFSGTRMEYVGELGDVLQLGAYGEMLGELQELRAELAEMREELVRAEALERYDAA